MSDLPNGFTGFANREPGFESAGEASRRLRDEPYVSNAVPAHMPDPVSAAAPVGAFQYARDVDSGRRVESELPFDFDAADETPLVDQRWAWLEIDLAAIRHNVAETRRYLAPRTRMMAVVKADGYGHGAVEVSKAALGAGADRLAVSTVTEGVKLRKAGVTAPITLLEQPPATSIPLVLAYKITPTIYEPDFAIAYGEAADLHGVEGAYHLAVNTGMNRLGVSYRDVVEFLTNVSFHRSLKLEGTFTEFATADSPETLDFQIQTKHFLEAIEDMQAAGYDPGVIHAAGSAATYRYPDVHFDMVRCGLALYGIHPCEQTRGFVDLRPAMSVHARITDVRSVPMSEGVSYGYRYRSPGSVKICTLPVGYADGLCRNLSGKVDFVMAGRYFRQVGAICMDQSMFEIDLRNRVNLGVDPQVGDHVLVVGVDGMAEVTIDELAQKAGTLPHEILIGFAQRMPRVYV